MQTFQHLAMQAKHAAKIERISFTEFLQQGDKTGHMCALLFSGQGNIERCLHDGLLHSVEGAPAHRILQAAHTDPLDRQIAQVLVRLHIRDRQLLIKVTRIHGYRNGGVRVLNRTGQLPECS